MKRYLIVLVLVLLVGVVFALPAYASEVTEAATLAIPSESTLESQVAGVVDDIDKTLSGVKWWEEAKEWIIANLGSIAGVLMTVATVIVGLATKFSFIPKIITAFKSLFASMKEWYSDNKGSLTEFRGILDTFVTDARKSIDKVEKQSEENNSLRKELVDVRKEYIALQNKNNALETALYSATILQADQFAKLIQLSGLTRADADALYEGYLEKKKMIEEALEETSTPVVEGVSEDV